MKTAALASATASVQKAERRYNPAKSEGFNRIFRQQVQIILIFYVRVTTACNFFHLKLQYFPRHFRLKAPPPFSIYIYTHIYIYIHTHIYIHIYTLYPSYKVTDFTPTKFTKQ